MAGEGSNEIGVFHFLVEIADKGAAGHVTAGDFIDRATFIFAGLGVHDRDNTGDATCLEDPLYGVVVFLRADEWKQSAVGRLSLVFLHQPLGTGI